MFKGFLSSKDSEGGAETASHSKAIGILSLLETILLLLAMYYLGFADGGIVGWFKLGVYGLAAWLVAFLVNLLAVEKGVSLAAKGSKIAGPLSGFSVFLVGAAFLMATFTGLTIPKVEEERLAAHIEVLERYSDGRIVVADKAAELVPIMHAMTKDLSTRADQEGETGWGPVARTLESLFGRANGLSTQMTISLGVRQEVLDRITSLRSAMEATLADETMGIWERRAILRKQHGQMLSLLAELDKAVPVSMVSSYARELQGGVLIPNREEASARINHTLGGFANTLMAALEDQSGVAHNPPRFPSKSGAFDSFKYAGKFAPVLLLTFIIDLLFPMLLWAYTLMTITREFPRTPKPPRPTSVYDTMTGRNAIDPSELPQRGKDAVDGSDEIKKPSPRPPHRPTNKSRR